MLFIRHSQGRTQTWGRFFRWGVATSGWGEWYIPPNSQKFRLRRAKKKKVAGFSEKFFTTWKKLPYPPNQFWPEVWRSLGEGVYTPHTPHAHVCFDPSSPNGNPALCTTQGDVRPNLIRGMFLHNRLHVNTKPKHVLTQFFMLITNLTAEIEKIVPQQINWKTLKFFVK